MTPAPALTLARRQALINRTDLAGHGRLRLVNAAGQSLVSIELDHPCGTVDATGVALADTEFAQVTTTGEVAAALLEDAAGERLATFTAGLASASPVPELPLPAAQLYAGAFVRLIGAHIVCD